MSPFCYYLDNKEDEMGDQFFNTPVPHCDYYIHTLCHGSHLVVLL